jgi:hypothetical protein
MSEPKFARRHYEAVAKVMRKAELMRQTYSPNGCEAATTWKNIRRELAVMFTADNPRFDRGRFEEACEP